MALTEETKKKISDALRGRPRPADVKEKIRESLRGQKHTEERKRHMSINALSNLQPLWQEENLRKPRKWQGEE